MAADPDAEVFTGLREEALREGRRKGRQEFAREFLATVLPPEHLASLEAAWQQADGTPDLELMLAVLNGHRPWTALLPPELPADPHAD